MLDAPEIAKSTRHSKITGDFTEALVLYWLSKHGFECARVDHTGMDLIARNPHTDELMGISVKSRCRNRGAEDAPLRIGRDNVEKLQVACKAFGCRPHFAFVIDAAETIHCFVVPLRYLEAVNKDRIQLHWSMRQQDMDRYSKQKQVIQFEFKSRTLRWWSP